VTTPITEVLPLLPTTLAAATAADQQHRREIRAWTYRNGGVLRNEVIADARHAKKGRQLQTS
jgi:hypothetical protein